MLQIEYRGYGQTPHKPENSIERGFVEGLYKSTFDLFCNISSLYIARRYELYNGKEDLFIEDGKINRNGELTKYLYDFYKDMVQQCNLAFWNSAPPIKTIKKFDILPDLNFVAVLKDGTVMCYVDKEN